MAVFGTAYLGDPVGNVIDRVQARHLLLLEEINGVRFAFREQRHQDIGAGHFLAARGLDMDGGTLQDALESSGRLGIPGLVQNQAIEFAIDIGGEILAQSVQLHPASAHHRHRVLVVDEGKEKVFQGGKLMASLVGKHQGLMEGLF